MRIEGLDYSRPVYVIGDVHGCLDTLCALIEKLPHKWESQIIFAGDLVDRGKESCGVVDLVMRQKYACVLGNHEELMVEYFDGIPNFQWLGNGRRETIKSYGKYFKDDDEGREKIKEHIEFIKSFPRFLEIDYKDEKGKNLFVTHGFGLPLLNKEIDARIYSWNRLKKNDKKLYGKEMDFSVFNVFGHDVQQDGVLITDNFAAIDTGCVYHTRLPNAALSALEWPSKCVISQEYCG